MKFRSLITAGAAVGLATGFACNDERQDVKEERKDLQEERQEAQEQREEEGQGGVFDEPSPEPETPPEPTPMR